MGEPFVVAFVLGVTPGKWARIWDERMPGHPLQLTALSPGDALSALRDGTADAAFVRLPVEDPSLSAIPLYEEQPVVVMPKEHVLSTLDAVSAVDLAEETVLDGEWEADVEIVAANVGVAIMPQSVARALSRKDVVARFATEAPTTRVALVWRADAGTELTEEFIGIVRGRTANSSRGATKPEPDRAPKKAPRPASGKPASKGKPARKPGSGAQPKRPKRR